jgi:Ca2+-binding RTX toxin-like protein
MASVSGAQNAPTVSTAYNNSNPSATSVPPNTTGNPNAVLLLVGTSSGPATDLSDVQVALNNTAAAATAAGYAGVAIQSADGLAYALLGNQLLTLQGPAVGGAPLPTISVQGGAAGAETIYGGANPILIAGAGAAESVVGGQAAMTVRGGTGPDTILGGSGTNLIVAGQAADFIAGGSGPNTIYGGSGDTIEGGAGSSVIYGGQGDTIQGNQGNNLIFGGPGDLIVTGAGTDTVFGTPGDTIIGGTGFAVIHGEAGGQLIGGANQGSQIFGGAGDTIAAGQGTGSSLIFANAGSEKVIGGNGPMTVIGGAFDTISGGSGPATIYGGAGNELIFGEQGPVTVTGGVGDTIGAGSSTNQVTLGAPSELFDEFAAGSQSTITGFQSGDSIQFAGENPSAISTVVGSATVAGGNTTLHLPDGSSIVLVGITKVDGTFFS